jgi:hypothetical protein
LFRKRGGLGVACGESADKPRKLSLGEARSEMDAGDPGRGKKLRETAFPGGRAQRNTIQQNLISGRSQKKAAFAAFL